MKMSLYENLIEITNVENNSTGKLLRMFKALKQLANSTSDIVIDHNQACVFLNVYTKVDFCALTLDSIEAFKEFDKLLFEFMNFNGILGVETDIITSNKVTKKGDKND